MRYNVIQSEGPNATTFRVIDGAVTAAGYPAGEFKVVQDNLAVEPARMLAAALNVAEGLKPPELSDEDVQCAALALENLMEGAVHNDYEDVIDLLQQFRDKSVDDLIQFLSDCWKFAPPDGINPKGLNPSKEDKS